MFVHIHVPFLPTCASIHEIDIDIEIIRMIKDLQFSADGKFAATASSHSVMIYPSKDWSKKCVARMASI